MTRPWNVPRSLPLFLLLLSPMSGCLGMKEGNEDSDVPRFSAPTAYDFPTVDGQGIRNATGKWYFEGRLETWALFMQEITNPVGKEFRASFDAVFEPERPLAGTDTVFVSEALVATVWRNVFVDLDFVWAKVAVGKGGLIENYGPIQVDPEGTRNFVVLYAMTSVPGTLKVGVDFQSEGAAKWRPTFAGAERVVATSATLRPGGNPVTLTLPHSDNATVALFIEEDPWRFPAWRNVTVGDAQPFIHSFEGRRQENEANNLVSAAGWLAVPGSSTRATVEYRGPGEPHQVVLATVPSNLSQLVKERYGVRLDSTLAGKGYDPPEEDV